jgi:hypothetical protein
LLILFELLESRNRSVKFAFYGSGVAKDEGEAALGFLGGLIGDEVDVEVFGFGFAGSIQAPHAAGDFVDDLDLEGVLRRVLLDESGYERVEFGSIFAGQDYVAAGQTVLQ